MGLKKQFVIFLLFGLIIFSCQKDSSVDNPCVPKTFTLVPFLKQFQFKVGSYWLFQSSTNASIDSMNVSLQQNPNYYNKLPSDQSNDQTSCYSFEAYTISLAHMGFLGGNYFSYTLNYDRVVLVGGATEYDKFFAYAVTNVPAPDSMKTKQGNLWVKLEAKFDTLTILGTKYTNVFQMHYTPAINKFQRIWWCPGIGFVRFEFINPSNQIETWDLKSHHVVF